LEILIEGRSIKEHIAETIAADKPLKDIMPTIVKDVPPDEVKQRLDLFHRTFREYVEDHRNYLLTQYNIPLDVDYYITPHTDFTQTITIRLKDYCYKRMDQHVPLVDFAQYILDINTIEDQKEEYRGITNFIREYAAEFPKKLKKIYPELLPGAPNLAAYLSPRLTWKFPKQTRVYAEVTKYDFEGLNLRQFYLKNLNTNPTTPVSTIYDRCVLKYPDSADYILTSLGREVNQWIKDQTDPLIAQRVNGALVLLRREHNKSIGAREKFYLALLRNQPLPQAREQYRTNYKKRYKENPSKATISTILSRLRGMVDYRFEHPRCTANTIFNRFKHNASSFVYTLLAEMKPSQLQTLDF